MRRLAQARAELLDEPRLADAGLADDEDKLALARKRALPAALNEAKLLLAADERGQRPGAAPAPAAAADHDAEELDRGGDALELARARILGDKKPGGLALDVRRDEHRARLGGRLDARGDVRRVAKNFAVRLDDDRAGLDPDARFQLRRALGGVLRVEVENRALNGERRPHRALGVVLAPADSRTAPSAHRRAA